MLFFFITSTLTCWPVPFHCQVQEKELIEAKEKLNNLNEWLIEHYEIIALLQLPIYTLGTYIAFKKRGYNFTEHLVLNAFLTAQRLILHIVAFPLYYIYNSKPALRTINGVIGLIGYALVIWTAIQFFNNSKNWLLFKSIAKPADISFYLAGFVAGNIVSAYESKIVVSHNPAKYFTGRDW